MTAMVDVDEDLVKAIVDQVWESLLQSIAMPWYGEEPAGALVRAEIELHGDWNGRVRLSCDAGTAAQMAGLMLAIDEDEQIGHEDVHDAVGEVVNVVGGNFKGCLEGTTSLGLPVVVHDAAADEAVPAARCLVEWRGAPVVVEVFAASQS